MSFQSPFVSDCVTMVQVVVRVDRLRPAPPAQVVVVRVLVDVWCSTTRLGDTKTRKRKTPRSRLRTLVAEVRALATGPYRSSHSRVELIGSKIHVRPNTRNSLV